MQKIPTNLVHFLERWNIMDLPKIGASMYHAQKMKASVYILKVFRHKAVHTIFRVLKMQKGLPGYLH